MEKITFLNKKEDNNFVCHLESGIDVNVKSKVFESKESKPGEAVIFLPGLQMNPDDNIVKDLGMSYAERSKRNTYIVTSELTKNTVEDIQPKESLFFEEALAIKEFIKKQNIKDIIIVGYSVGGYKGIDLAYILQKDVTCSVKGLVLLSSPGLYEQKAGMLKKNLINDSLATPIDVLSESSKYSNAFKRGFNGVSGFTKIVLNTSLNTDVGKKIKRDFSEMEKYNTHVEELEIPIVVIQGSGDMVVEAEKITPKEISSSDRERYLKNNIFKKSPKVKMVIADHLGRHGLPVFRSESVANASIGLLERMHK